PVTVSGLALNAGGDSANYSLSQPSPTANITAKPLTVSAAGVNKIYDGNNTATVNLSDNRVSGDVLTTAYTGATFGGTSPNTYTVSVTGISVTGTDSVNYT